MQRATMSVIYTSGEIAMAMQPAAAYAHLAQASDLSSMHAPLLGLRGCLNFFWPG